MTKLKSRQFSIKRDHVFALLPLPNKLEQMLSCIHLFPAPAHHLLPLPNRTRLMPGRVCGLF